MAIAYFDNNATTAVCPEALEAMVLCLREQYHNVSSVAGDVLGLRRVLGDARRRIARLLDLADSTECVFTSGATESNNWVVEGIASQAADPGHVITTAIEHPSVLEAVHRLEPKGWRVTVIRPDHRGLIPIPAVTGALRPDTRLVSVMLANNETGIIQPLGAIASAIKAIAPHTVIHSDATQAIGKFPVSLSDTFSDVDLLSCSAHKFHGPKGCGVLVIRDGVDLPPLLVGGGQEEGRRSGTLNLPAIVGGGVAASQAAAHLGEVRRVAELRDRFEAMLVEQVPSAILFGKNEPRLANTSCFALPPHNANVLADALALRELHVGTGSACSSGALQPPKSLLAMGVPHSLASCSLRVSLSRYSDEAEIDRLIRELTRFIDESDCRPPALAVST